jgi:hypothetical protein
VVSFAVLSAAVGLVTRADIELLGSMFRRRGTLPPAIPAP